LRTVALAVAEGFTPRRIRVASGGLELEAAFVHANGRVELTLANEHSLRAGEALDVEIS
jgi:hypothetical protein